MTIDNTCWTFAADGVDWVPLALCSIIHSSPQPYEVGTIIAPILKWGNWRLRGNLTCLKVSWLTSGRARSVWHLWESLPFICMIYWLPSMDLIPLWKSLMSSEWIQGPNYRKGGKQLALQVKTKVLAMDNRACCVAPARTLQPPPATFSLLCYVPASWAFLPFQSLNCKALTFLPS